MQVPPRFACPRNIRTSEFSREWILPCSVGEGVGEKHELTNLGRHLEQASLLPRAHLQVIATVPGRRNRSRRQGSPSFRKRSSEGGG